MGNPDLSRTVLSVLVATAIIWPVPVAAQQLDTLCAGILNSYECAQRIEKVQLDRYGDRVVRDSSRLVIQLEYGDSVILADSVTDDWSSDRLYSYREYLPTIGYHVVEVQYVEGGAYLLVNARTGEKQVLCGVPVPSPDGERIVLTSVDLDAQYVPTTVQVWTVGEDGVQMEWRFDPLDVQEGVFPYDELWGLSDAEWLSPTEIRLRRVYSTDRAAEAVLIELKDDGWILHEPDA